MARFIMAIIAVVLSLEVGVVEASGRITADHRAAREFSAIPINVLHDICDRYSVFYGHTSHGSQLKQGMSMLYLGDPQKYPVLGYDHLPKDLGSLGDTSWAQMTREYLDGHPLCDIVIWSWCSGVSDNTQEGIAAYLGAMAALERDYPGVVFVYMTGHLDGTGPQGNLHVRNEQIRAFCRDNHKVLYDFADIESYDPAGTAYPYDDDSCQWCLSWCAEHDCPCQLSCPHSHCFSCLQKGKAFWWLLARIAGWSHATTAEPPAPRVVLQPCWPNPFNPSTSFSFTIPEAAPVRLSVLDGQGRLVSVVVDGQLPSGDHHFVWRGSDRLGRPLPSGNYFYQLVTGSVRETRKMTLLK